MRITTLPRILASKVVPDSDLDLRPYGVVAAFSRAPFCGSWPTETLDWGGDVAPFEVTTHTDAYVSTDGNLIPIVTAEKGRKVTVKVTRPNTGGSAGFTSVLKVNGVDVESMPVVTVGQTKQFNPVILNAGDVLAIHTKSTSAINASSITIVLMDSGLAVGAKTFDLSGKWLALGLDMKGLAATVKIQGVEMPYSDYAKYFPITPSELKIPGDWTPEQIRPVIEVYA